MEKGLLTKLYEDHSQEFSTFTKSRTWFTVYLNMFQEDCALDRAWKYRVAVLPKPR